MSGVIGIYAVFFLTEMANPGTIFSGNAISLFFWLWIGLMVLAIKCDKKAKIVQTPQMAYEENKERIKNYVKSEIAIYKQYSEELKAKKEMDNQEIDYLEEFYNGGELI